MVEYCGLVKCLYDFESSAPPKAILLPKHRALHQESALRAGNQMQLISFEHRHLVKFASACSLGRFPRPRTSPENTKNVEHVTSDCSNGGCLIQTRLEVRRRLPARSSRASKKIKIKTVDGGSKSRWVSIMVGGDGCSLLPRS